MERRRKRRIWHHISNSSIDNFITILYVCLQVCLRACQRLCASRRAAGGQKETDQIFILFVQFCDDETADSSPNLFGFCIRSRYSDFCTASDQRCFERRKKFDKRAALASEQKHAQLNRVSECGQTLLAYQFVCNEAIEHRLKPGELQIERKAQTPAQVSQTKGKILDDRGRERGDGRTERESAHRNSYEYCEWT